MAEDLYELRQNEQANNYHSLAESDLKQQIKD
jgi:hypothetical protein